MSIKNNSRIRDARRIGVSGFIPMSIVEAVIAGSFGITAFAQARAVK
jgi:hypothetical protein